MPDVRTSQDNHVIPYRVLISGKDRQMGIFLNLQRKIRVPHYDRVKLEQYRLHLLRKQIEYCTDRVPYYSRLFRKIGLAGKHITSLNVLREIPPISKEDIRGNYHAFISRDYDIHRLHKSHTSGSTGQPFWTFYDRECWVIKKYFSKYRARYFCGLRPGDKIAKLECEPVSTIDKERRKLISPQRMMRMRTFSIFDDVDRVADALMQYKPRHIYGYPSFLLRLAQFAELQGISFPQLRRIFTSSEYLSYTVSAYLSKMFKAGVYDIYGCNEFKEVAWQCRPNVGYHINEDELIVEIIDDRGRSEIGDTDGQIIITDLLNRAMPLIRYRMKERGMKLSGQCQCGCGFARMKPLAGRASDDIILPNGKALSPYMITTSIEKTTGLLQYQVVQEAADVLKAHLILNSESKESASRQIDVILRNLTDGLMDIKINLCNHIDVEENGKFRVIKKLIN